MKKKEYKILLVLLGLCLLAGLHEKLGDSDFQTDIFLFYDYPKDGRWLSNIFMDISGLVTRTSLLYLLYYIATTKNLKKISMAFFILSCSDVVDYFLFFQQHAHIKLLGLLCFMVWFLGGKAYKIYKQGNYGKTDNSR